MTLPPASPLQAGDAASRCRRHRLTPTPFLPPLPTLFSPFSLPATHCRHLACVAAGHQLRRRPPATLPSPFPLFPNSSQARTTHARRLRVTQGHLLHVLSPAVSAAAGQLRTTATLTVDRTSLTRPPPTPTRPLTSLPRPPPALAGAVLSCSCSRRRRKLLRRSLPPAGSSPSGHLVPTRLSSSSSFIPHSNTTSWHSRRFAAFPPVAGHCRCRPVVGWPEQHRSGLVTS